jgi:alpha-ketoglutarate-dependent taurine dioxygenase
MQPYLLKETQAYAAWREQKLNNYPKCAEELIIELNNPINLVDNAIKALESTCSKTNMVIYRCNLGELDGKQRVISLAEQLGLNQLDANICADEDRISTIQDAAQQSTEQNRAEQKSHYIPYTNKPLNWHTDGYYNSKEQQIQAFLMHCVRPAKSGGENSYLDPEIAYILLRDENPDYISALMQNDVMMVPANEINEKQIRPAQTGPVFFVDKSSQALCMRYTARQRNIVWKQDKMVQSALTFIQEMLQGNPYVFHYSLNASEGVICNNVLHNRTAFEDHQDENNKRLLYRGRFYNRVAMHTKTLQNAVNT